MGSRIVQINGHFLNVCREGFGLPTVLLHGWGSSWHHWEFLIPELTSAGYAVYAPDLYGHGKSAHPNNAAEYPIETYYQSICRWIKTEGIGRPLLIGHSMGGYLGLKFALDHPQDVAGMVLINPLVAPQQIAISPFLKNQTLPLLGELLLKWTPEWLVKSSLDFNRQDTTDLPAAFQHQTALDYKRASPHIVRTLNTIKDLRPSLNQIQTPILLVWGDRDLTLNPKIHADLLKQLPCVQGCCFKGCYHAPHLAQRERFNKLLLSFVDQLLLEKANIQA
jgi:pimeloyl-ACP methyl ester carboxylesterase